MQRPLLQLLRRQHRRAHEDDPPPRPAEPRSPAKLHRHGQEPELEQVREDEQPLAGYRPQLEADEAEHDQAGQGEEAGRGDPEVGEPDAVHAVLGVMRVEAEAGE